jgi:hypothetical protein
MFIPFGKVAVRLSYAAQLAFGGLEVMKSFYGDFWIVNADGPGLRALGVDATRDPAWRPE